MNSKIEEQLLLELELLTEECKTQGDDSRIDNVIEYVDKLLQSQLDTLEKAIKGMEVMFTPEDYDNFRMDGTDTDGWIKKQDILTIIRKMK